MPDRLKFSVIIPTCNRQACLRTCLQSLARQNYPKSNFEVIVVDDASFPPVQDSIRMEFQELHISLHHILQNEGPASARNGGAECARGQYLVFTDDDCVSDANWLSKIESILATAPSNAVGGLIVDGEKNLYSTASHAVLSAAYEYYNACGASPRFFGCANMAVPTKEFREIGGFLPEFRASEDREFCARWLRNGYGLTFAPEAVVVHEPPLGLKHFLRRHYSYGRGAYRFWSLQARIKKDRLKIEGPAFYMKLILHPMKMQSGLRGIEISFLAVVSQVASLLGFLAERRHTASSHMN